MRVSFEAPLAGMSGVVTGAAGGIGRDICAGFHAAGARVALFDINGDEVRRLASDFGDGCIGVGVDVTKPDEVAAAFDEAAAHFGKLDFLINNAGIRYEVPFLDHDLARWQKTLDVNLTGPFLCAQSAARLMIPTGGGSIVNIASISGLSAFRKRPAYVSSKAGLMGLTRAIAWELGPVGIRCNTVVPGILSTPLTQHYFEDPEMVSLIKNATPLERWGEADDVVGPIIFLCSPASKYIQGQSIVVDGGWLSGKGY